MNSISDLKKYIEKNIDKRDRIVRGIWSVDCLFNPGSNGRVFNYKFLVAQTRGQGCSYSLQESYDVNYLHSLIGKDFLELQINDPALMVALLDSAYNPIESELKTSRKTMISDSEKKLHWRSKIIRDESYFLLGQLKKKKVINVGVVGDIIQTFLKEDCFVCGTDFDESIIGKTLFDKAPIYPGEETLERIREADLAIVTGMTVTTETLDDIIQECKKHKTKLIVFAETGSNLGEFYVERGVDCYLGEKFPFYIFNGMSTIEVIKKKRDVQVVMSNNSFPSFE